MTVRASIIAEIEARMRWGIYKREDQDLLLALVKGDGGEPLRANDSTSAHGPRVTLPISTPASMLVDAV